MMNGNNPAGVWVSWANWGWNDKGESCSYLNPGSCDAHNWGSHSNSGSHVDGYLKSPGPPAPGPTPPSPPSPSPGGQCSLTPGQNNGGTNLKATAEHTSSADDCCSTCSSTSGCVGFTWVTANHECWLKSSIASLKSDPYVTSGSVSTPTPTPPPPTPPTPTPPPPTPPSSTCTCSCEGDDLKACISACPPDEFAECIQTCESPCPTTMTTTAAAACKCGCAGDDLHSCIEACPADKYSECIKTCSSPCVGNPCTGSDDGSDLHHCIAHCPSAGYADCITCCTGEFPSLLV